MFSLRYHLLSAIFCTYCTCALAISEEDKTAFLNAADDGEVHIIENFLNQYANEKQELMNAKDEDGFGPLHCACFTKTKGIAELLIKNGADVHATSNEMATPLHISCYEGNQDVAETLIKNGANVNAKSSEELTPLHIACLMGHKNLVKLFIENGADIHALDENGNTPLHFASIGGRIPDEDFDDEEFKEDFKAAINPGGYKEIVTLLLENNAYINAQNIYGNTALHIASLTQDQEMIGLLIPAGASINIQNNDGDTPLDLAFPKTQADETPKITI